IAPIALAGKIGDGHELDGGDPELGQLSEPLTGGSESSLRRERPDMELINNALLPWTAAPPVRAPGIILRRYDLARALDIERLKTVSAPVGSGKLSAQP